ncbi:ferrous iron transport protein B [Virgisporangium ochraceum]|uniref:Ferrous iron transport protein B n=1 Tax=Virgisporangium ochraceum TaxID=65505 RepID=A0A8J4EH05_9ACTN|nr:ferrous iron transport protein B [Virgisporangium ochraceum]GIJ75340.1 ferrous iron transport protein B [Virgisporangium ochraceum]
MAPTGRPATLDRPDLAATSVRRLAELGLRTGSTVTPLHRTAGGGRVVGVGTTRVAVARAVLSRMALRGHARPTASTGHPPPGDVPPPSTRPTAAHHCHGDSGGTAPAGAPVVALVGSPNVGKSTLFNALTGARRRVGNWPGTTVEVGRGTWRVRDRPLAVVDLPGAYSLDPLSLDERLTRELLVDVAPAERPDVVAVVVSAADAARGLYLLSQVREHGPRVVVVLTMTDVAAARGVQVDVDALAAALGVPVVAVDPRRRRGVDRLGPAVLRALDLPAPDPVRLFPDDDAPDEFTVADARFSEVAELIDATTRRTGPDRQTWSDRVDRFVTSPVLGLPLFLAVMWGVFQLTTAGAAPLVDGLDRLFAGPVSRGAGALVGAVGLGGTWVEGFVVDGLVAGVGMVLTFVPLMVLMFLLLALLEDSGYLARAAVVVDRLMRAVGLPGRAFIPLVVGFGCNVPAVAATRVLPDARHRLLTTLLVPFTTCSARLPVYVLVGSAIFGRRAGTVVFAMYVASILLVVLGGLLLRMTLLRGVRPEPLVLDLPSYQVPVPRMLAVVTWTRLLAFLRTATGIIVVTVAAVWLLSATPAHPGAGTFGAVTVEDSAFGAVSSAVAPVFAPAGFGDWHTTGALLVGFVAKEAVISSWAQTYAADEPADPAPDPAPDPAQPGRIGALVHADFTESSGGHPGPAGLAFLLFLLGYAPCVATMTAQVREVGRRWTAIGVTMNLTVSWLVAVLVFQIGRLFL